MQLVDSWLNMESFKMLFVKWRICLKNVVLQRTKYLENPCSSHFSCLSDRSLGLDWILKLLSALSKRQRSALYPLPQKWFPALCSSKLDSRPVGLRTAAAAVRSLQTEMHLHRNATKITQKEGEEKKAEKEASLHLEENQRPLPAQTSRDQSGLLTYCSLPYRWCRFSCTQKLCYH